MTIFIDRLEGDKAVCEMDGKTFSLPIWVLPDGASEGDALSLLLDPNTKAAQKAKIKALEDKLFR